MEFRCDERNNYSLLPVTALQFCCVSGGEVLLEGMKAYDVEACAYQRWLVKLQ